MPIASLADILSIERAPLSERLVPPTTYEMLKTGSHVAPDVPALTFFAQTKRFKKATVWSHRELIRRITQAANLFRRLGVGRDGAGAFVVSKMVGPDCVSCVDAPLDASVFLWVPACGQALSCVRPHSAAVHTPRACMEVRGSGPNRRGALEALRNTLVFPTPSH
jgi:hypothetical protein